MGSYDDLRGVIKHITDATGDANAWQVGLTPQQIRDVKGWLASDGTGYRGYRDPDTGVIYEDRSHTNTAKNPAVPDEALNRIRQGHPTLFDPTSRAPITPPPAPPPPPNAPPPGAPAPGNPAPGQGAQPNPDQGLSTDEENSGRAADAIGKVQKELSDRQSNVHEADAKLAEIMLSAHAKSADSLADIQRMQKDIVTALNDPKNNLDTKDGELQFLKFLHEKAEKAKQLVNEGKLTSEDSAKMAMALADYYQQGQQGQNGQSGEQQQGGEQQGANQQGGQPVEPVDPGLYPTDPGLLGPSPQMPDPSLGDLGATSPLSDALQAAAPLLSGMGNPLGGGIPGGGLDLGAITKPIGDAISAAADHPKDDPKPEDNKPEGKSGDDKPEAKPGDDKPGDKPGEKPAEQNAPGAKPEQPAPAPAPAPGSVADPAAVAPPAPSLQVDLKDGSHVTAADTSRAGATRSLLAGTPYGEALRLNNLVAPPPGSTLTNYLGPNQLQPADYAMYQDKLVGVLGPDKFVGANGQPQPLNTLPQDGFLGFGRPTPASGTVTAAGTAAPPPVIPPTAPVVAQQPPPPAPPQGPK